MKKTKYGSYELLMDWKTSDAGFIAVASKGDKLFTLEQHRSYILPDETKAEKSPALYARLKQNFDEFKDNHIAVNTALAATEKDGNVNYPTDWFVQDRFFTEATPFLPNVMDGDEIAKMPTEDIVFIMKEAAKALAAIHRTKVVHGNLNIRNIVAMKGFYYGSPLKYLVKITNFNRSFFDGKIPPADLIGGTQQFISPEMTECLIRDREESSLTKLSAKTDIFSLGVVFYEYLSKRVYPPYADLPDYLKDKPIVYPGEALCCGGKIVLKIDILKENYIVRLLANMLHPDPDKRPTAEEVAEVLETEALMKVPNTDKIVTEF